MLDGCGGRKSGKPGDKPSEPTTNVSHILLWHQVGIKTGPYWWEVNLPPHLIHHCAIPAPWDGATLVRGLLQKLIGWQISLLLSGYVTTEMCSSPSKASDNYKSKLVKNLIVRRWTIWLLSWGWVSDLKKENHTVLYCKHMCTPKNSHARLLPKK